MNCFLSKKVYICLNDMDVQEPRSTSPEEDRLCLSAHSRHHGISAWLLVFSAFVSLSFLCWIQGSFFFSPAPQLQLAGQ